MLARGSRSIFLSSPLTTFRLLATQPESMNVFDRRAKLLQRERALDRSGDNPKTYEYLREEVIIFYRIVSCTKGPKSSFGHL